MKRKSITLIIMGVALTIGIYLYLTNNDFKNFISKKIIGEKKKIEQISTEIYLLADGTYSVNLDYAIPKLNKEFINNICDSVHYHGGGKVWLSYIDRNSKNNKCLYFSISPVSHRELRPEGKGGESSFELSDMIKKWEKRIENFSEDSLKYENLYDKNKNEFIEKSNNLLENTVYVKSPENKNTDAIGSLTNAFSTLENNHSDKNKIKKYIVVFSDLEQDAPDLPKESNEIEKPVDVSILMVNPNPGKSNKCIEDVSEIETPERIFENIFNN